VSDESNEVLRTLLTVNPVEFDKEFVRLVVAAGPTGTKRDEILNFAVETIETAEVDECVMAQIIANALVHLDLTDVEIKRLRVTAWRGRPRNPRAYKMLIGYLENK
jgi:hypothetical protein